jgi:hypothetical protein
MNVDGFHNFLKNIIVKILLATLFRKLVTAFLHIAACVSKVFESHLWSWKLFWKPAMNVQFYIVQYTRENRQMREKESKNRNLMRISEQF